MHIKEKYCKKLLKEGQSLVPWIWGYYISKGGPHGINHKIPILTITFKKEDIQILVETHDDLMWINVNKEDVFYGYCGKDSPAEEGQKIQTQLEIIRKHG